jgi:protein-L-isoaspartate O-methyltransferase
VLAITRDTAALLTTIGEQRGAPVPAPYAAALHAVPRHLFLPDRFWVRDGHGGYQPVDRSTDPDAWARAAYSDQPLVTQFTDGAPSSSASMPSMVLYQLELAGIADLAHQPGHDAQDGRSGARDGHGGQGGRDDGGEDARGGGGAAPRVLELGTGTGFNAGLLCALLGQDAVTTLDVDPALVAQAAVNLVTVGFAPAVTVADASAPDALPAGPYDRILATFSVNRIPDPWRTQVRPRGRIVTPWYSDWTAYGMLTLAVAADGIAQGCFHPHGSYMVMRTPDGPHAPAQTPAEPCPAPAPTSGTTAGTATSRTRLSPWTVTADPDIEFHLGLTVPHVSYDWDTTGEHAPIRFALYAADGSSATVDYDGQQAAEFTVTQRGPRALWTETEVAYVRWEQFGRPTVERHGLTVTPDGAHHVWIDRPDNLLTDLLHGV